MAPIHAAARRRLDRIYRDQPALLAEGLEAMQAEQRALGNLYGGEPIRSLPDPLLVDPARFAPLGRKVVALRRLLEAEAGQLVREDRFQEILGMEDLQADLVRASGQRPGRPTPVARVDGMWTRGGLKVVEINTDGSTGILDCYALAAAAKKAPALRKLAEGYRLEARSLFRGIAAELVKLHQGAGGEGTPRVAILDWETVKSRYEQQELARRLTELGVPTTWCDPRAVRRTRGRLRGPDGPIDIVYKRVLTSELLERRGEVDAYLKAVLAGQVLQLDPFTADILYDKGFLAWVREPEVSSRLRAPQRKLVKELLPDSRLFPFDATRRSWAEKNRARMVLKPRTEYGGKGVVLGPRTGKMPWAKALDKAEASGDRYLLQEFVTPIRHSVWEPRARGKAKATELFGIVGIWLVGDRAPGLYMRAGPDPVINVSSGAYGLPVLYVRRKR